MKTPKMSATEKRAWLAAIGKLERFYRAVVSGKKPPLFCCPLCEARDKYQKDWGNSSDCYCPWYWYKDCYCGVALSLRYDRDIPWAKSSLKRLTRWRKRLEVKD